MARPSNNAGPQSSGLSRPLKDFRVLDSTQGDRPVRQPIKPVAVLQQGLQVLA